MCSRIPICDENPENMGELRIVLYGLTRQGKSTLGGIILNDRGILTSKDPSDKGTNKCHKERKIINGQEVVVVDTPGLFKEDDDREKVVEEIKRSIKHAEPGPHVFLFVERFKEISQEKLDALKVFQDTFGKQAVDYTIVVFTTKKKKMKDMQETLQTLTKLTKDFQGYFVFDIKDVEQRESQVAELLAKITQIKNHTPGCYTPKMLQEAEEALKQQKEAKTKPQEWRSFYDRCGLIGMAVGCAVGYFICGGELTPTSGAGVGAVVGMMLSVGIAFLGILAKIKIQTWCR